MQGVAAHVCDVDTRISPTWSRRNPALPSFTQRGTARCVVMRSIATGGTSMQSPTILMLAMSLGLTACSGPTPNTVIHAATGDAALMPVTWGTNASPSTPPASSAPSVTQTQTVNVVVGPTSRVEPAVPHKAEGVDETKIAIVTNGSGIELGSGKRILYSGPATFFLLDAEKGVRGMLLVDVREPGSGYISDVWMFDGADWRHGTMVESVPLSERISMPISSPPPPRTFGRFDVGLTWLVSNGAVVPGPSFRQALLALGRPSDLAGEPRASAGRRNMLRFALALEHFRREEMKPCEHIKPLSETLLSGFARMNHPSIAE
ncbi:hypothetical protein [Polyangium fumosum]|uniref:Uncharacterized protein n=1 Tax=Polyangium fumosum TaxID=889272 RepID=A0A4U1IYU2_9BACT|nr:hypothetical protein [Polyangium fumosum]TKC99854.1 hypothetical protein E8A74_36175 [Polyangium fumosum]